MSVRSKFVLRVALLALGLLLVASVIVNYVLMRRLNAYRDVNPPRAEFTAGKCPGEGLVGHWRFEDLNDDDSTADATPHAHHARLQTTPRPLAQLRYGAVRQVGGPAGKALEFRGHHWLSVGNNDCFTTGRFTFAAWIWLGEVGSVPTIAGKTAWPHNGWWLMTTTRGPQREDRYLDLGILWPGGRAHVESGYRLPLREWHHVVVTADNDRREVAFFLDGKPLSRHRDVPKWAVNWDHDFVIGDYDGTTRWPWIGMLDEVRFYNYVLPDAEAAALYASSR